MLSTPKGCWLKVKWHQNLETTQERKRVGELSEETITSVKALNVTQLEELGEALLDFTVSDDLLHWLEANRAE